MKYSNKQRTTLVFAKAGQTEAVFQLFVFQFGFISGRKSIPQPSQIPAR